MIMLRHSIGFMRLVDVDEAKKSSGPWGAADRGVIRPPTATHQVAWATEAAAAGRGPRETAATVQPPAWRRADFGAEACVAGETGGGVAAW